MNTRFVPLPKNRRAFLAEGAALAAAAAALADGASRPAQAKSASVGSIVELRQYTLHPGQRDVLIELFDCEFLESQEQLGIRVMGQFRDLDRPDMFVWLRGFPDMEMRQRALTEFYSGPVWVEHRNAANATMIDSDNVLMLKPARPDSGFAGKDKPRAPLGASEIASTVVTASIWYFAAPPDAGAIKRFATEALPALEGEGAPAIAWFVTEDAENNYPRLPVRTGENVLVWLSSYPDEAAERNIAARLEASKGWNTVLDSFAAGFTRAPERLRLSPTPRSRLR